jgi:AraC-like DNA-binding protein
LFAVFTGPVFDTLATAGVLADTGPQARRSTSSIRALRTLLCATPRSPLAAEHQLLSLADWLLDTAKPPAATGLTPLVAAAVDRLSDDLDASIDMKALAAELGLPYHTFRRRFTTEVGLAPTTFRSTRRIQTAATLLRLTNMTVRQIASTLGYTDEFHLSRRFRTYFGVPPSKYRRSG